MHDLRYGRRRHRMSRGIRRPGRGTAVLAALTALGLVACRGDGPTEPPPNGNNQNPPGVPSVGDTLRFFMAVQPDLSVDCQDTDNVIAAVVRDVGDGFALVEDTAVTPGLMDYDALNFELDEIVFPTATEYWGTPADLDENDRVIVLFTAEVNRLTEEGSDTFIAGFFWPGDLSTQSACPASNAGEILYLLAPDPAGEFGDAVSADAARRNARGVVAHEFQHLLTAQQRVTKGGGSFADLENTWLSEGFAHIAEEVAGLAVGGFTVGSNITFSQALQSEQHVTAFNSYHLSNFVRLAHFFTDPSNTRTLADEDPGGFGSLRLRGWGWILLRWVADQYAGPGSLGHLSGSGSSADAAFAGEAPTSGAASTPELGEIEIVRGPDAVRSFQLDGGTAGRTYMLAVQSADTTAGATVPMRLRVTPEGSSAIHAGASRSVSGAPTGGLLTREERISLGEARLKSNMQRELERVRPAFLRQRESRIFRSVRPSASLSAGQAAEAALFLELSRGNPGQPDGRGVRNLVRALEEVTGQSIAWEDLLGLFSSMPAVTDTDASPVAPETQIRTWDLRDIFEGLHNANWQGDRPAVFDQPYPLQLTEIDLNGGVETVQFEVNASAQRYFLLSGDALTPNATVELSTQAGGTLPASSEPQVTVVRLE